MLNDVSCVIHVHSLHSDGRSTLAELLVAAREARRDVLIITDHDTLGARRAGWEGWHDDVLVLVGHEVSTSGGHLLALGLDEEVRHQSVPEAEIPSKVVAAGGLGFAAHPFSRGSRMSRRIGRPHPWPHLEDPAVGGVELWSLVTDAAEGWRSPREAIAFLRDPDSVLLGPPGENVRAWDRLCLRRRLPAIGGLDAHEKGFRLPGGRLITPFPNRRFFSLLGTHALLERELSGTVQGDSEAIYAALGAGRSYISRDSLGDPAGFGFWAEGNLGRAEMGEWTDGPEVTLRVDAPADAEIDLIRNGEHLDTRRGRGADWPQMGPGVYRVEARRADEDPRRTWILSNPIWVGDASG